MGLHLGCACQLQRAACLWTPRYSQRQEGWQAQGREQAAHCSFDCRENGIHIIVVCMPTR